MKAILIKENNEIEMIYTDTKMTLKELQEKVDGYIEWVTIDSSNNTGYYVDPAGTASANFAGYSYFANHGGGIVGNYSSFRYQLVWAIGDSYKGSLDGTSVAGGYGLWFSHPNAGGVAANLSTHGLMLIQNGSFMASLDPSMRAVNDMRSPIFYDLNNTALYTDPSSTSVLSALTLGGRSTTNAVFYAGFTLDANTMPTNSTGFTYSVNAPFTGPIMRVGDGGYDLWFNAPYGGGGRLAFRTRNGDTASINAWQYPALYNQLSAWSSSAPVEVLPQGDLECAVAHGAAFYGGVVSCGHALRIRAGLSRSYYIGVEPSELAVPGLQSHMKGVCVAPQGLEEGTGCEIPEREFLLASGESIEFKLFTSNERSSDVAGSEVLNAEGMLHEAGTIKATIESSEPYVPVVLQSRLSEIGALEISLRQRGGEGAWCFEFDVRGEG